MKFDNSKSAVVFFGILFSIGLTNISAQDTLRIEDAIQKGLEKNFAIRIAKNEAQISANNNSFGNAGFLPVVAADGTVSKRIENNETQYSANSIPDRNDKGAKTTNYNYGLDATWTVFDGLTMFATKDRLTLEADIGDEQARLEIENLLADLISGYYQIVAQQKVYKVLENTVQISEERIRIAETKKDLGSGSEYNLLQARADYNADRAALIRSGTLLKQAKIVVNQILSNSTFADFEVQTAIEMGEIMNLNLLLEKASSENKSLMIARLNERVANQEIEELRGDWFPQVDVTGGYGYNKTETSTGFVDFSKTTGFNYGITARINLFDGFNKNRRTQNARLRLKNQQLQLEDLKLNIVSETQQVYEQYIDALSLIELEQQNLQYTKQSQEIALERFRLGTINSLELREAQLSLLNAENRLIVAQIEAKNAETELLRISGDLLRRVE